MNILMLMQQSSAAPGRTPVGFRPGEGAAPRIQGCEIVDVC